MTETQRDECLIQLVKSVNNLETKLNENIEFTKSIDAKLNENIEFTKSIDAKLNENIEFTKSIDAKLNENIEFTKSIDAKLNEVNSSLSSRIDSIENKLDENIAFTRRINQSVAVMEVDHGGKLNALFDGYKANSEKLDKIETDIQNIQSIVEKHDNEIYLIKSR